VTPPPTPQDVPQRLSGIALRITGIVFWGLVAMGLGLAIVLLNDLKGDTIRHYDILSDDISYELRRALQQEGGTDTAAIAARLHELRKNHNVGSLVLNIDGHAITEGKAAVNSYSVQRTVRYRAPDGTQKNANFILHYPSLDKIMSDRRKRMLVTMGGGFLLFGFVLQWVLQRVLTAPILRMVESAQQISAGDNERRFNETAAGEFGYLAQFMNKSLDYLTAQRNELSEALTRIRESESELFQEKERAVVTLHSIGDAVITTNADGLIEYLNPVAEKLTGWDMEALQGHPIQDALQVIDERSGEPMENPVARCLREQSVIEAGQHSCLRRRDGRQLAIADSAAPIRDRAGRVIGAILVFQDVTPTRRLANQLSYQATHDALTGLYNRREFEDQIKSALDSARSENAQHVLCYLDLDQFKIVNDTCGHVAGDELLRQLAGLLQKSVRDSDVIARLGGDEIGILIKYCELDMARRIADEIRIRVKNFRYCWEDRTFEIGACIGVVAVTPDSRSVAELLSAADMACYAAKDLGRNRVHVYQPDDRELEQRRGEMQWVSRITQAMDEDRFCLYYQPVIALDGTSPPLYEMLVRLRAKDGTLVPPMAFIPAAERYGIMSALDRWVVRRALDYVGKATRMRAGCTCAINLSGQSLSDETFLQFVVDEIEHSGASPERLCFEVTETTAVANLGRATEFISTLRARGCRFALDDFGSGLSSFAYLKNLEVDFLKMDGGFVQDMLNDPLDRAMVEAVNQIGHVMGVRTIAEFVENQDVLNALRALGVDYAQGFHIAQPKPMDEWCEFNADTSLVPKSVPDFADDSVPARHSQGA